MANRKWTIILATKRKLCFILPSRKRWIVSAIEEETVASKEEVVDCFGHQRKLGVVMARLAKTVATKEEAAGCLGQAS